MGVLDRLMQRRNKNAGGGSNENENEGQGNETPVLSAEAAVAISQLEAQNATLTSANETLTTNYNAALTDAREDARKMCVRTYGEDNARYAARKERLQAASYADARAMLAEASADFAETPAGKATGTPQTAPAGQSENNEKPDTKATREAGRAAAQRRNGTAGATASAAKGAGE